MNDADSPYAAPAARVEDPPQERGSVLVGFFLGCAALLGGGLLAVGWIMLVIMLAAVESSRVATLWPLGFVVVPLAPLLAARSFFRRDRPDTAHGILMAVVVAVALAGLLVAYLWFS